MILEVRLLGPVEASVEGEPVRLGGPKPRGVLALLALNAGRVVSTERMVEGLWGDDAPLGAPASLQVHMSNLRKALGAAGSQVVTRAPGYLLDLPPGAVDAGEAERLVEAAGSLRRDGDVAGARAHLDRALDLWRGDPLDDLALAPFVEPARIRLEELRHAATELRFDLALDAGEHAGLVAPLERAVGEHPLRERLWGQLMVALYRSGRQAEALGAYRRARAVLLEELGIEPGSELRALEMAVLDQDPALDPPAEGAGRSASGAPAGPGVDAGATVKSPAGGRSWLVLEDGSERELDGPLVLGRNADCDIPLSDPSVSRRHAEVRPALGGRILIDLGSTNGTVVNGELVLQCLLQDGDRIAVGVHSFTFRSSLSGSSADL